MTNPNRKVYDLYAGKKKVDASADLFVNDADDFEMFKYHVLKRLEKLEGV